MIPMQNLSPSGPILPLRVLLLVAPSATPTLESSPFSSFLTHSNSGHFLGQVLHLEKFSSPSLCKRRQHLSLKDGGSQGGCSVLPAQLFSPLTVAPGLAHPWAPMTQHSSWHTGNFLNVCRMGSGEVTKKRVGRVGRIRAHFMC